MKPGLLEARTEEERAALIEEGRVLFAQSCTFFYASQKIDQLPPVGGPEIAFCGRSNVGKSSIINALTNQKSLARVSNTPGRTKQLNFFNLGDRLTIVDMPGYGYAQASKSVKEDWQGLMFDFLRGRPTLRRVVLLMDGRIETKKTDLQAMHLLRDAAVPYQVVLTKADDVKPMKLAARQAEVEEVLRKQPGAFPLILTTSSETGLGLDLLRAELSTLAEDAPTSAV